MAQSIQGKTAIVTGAGSGKGQSIGYEQYGLPFLRHQPGVCETTVAEWRKCRLCRFVSATRSTDID
jgi:hypothetical protein